MPNLKMTAVLAAAAFGAVLAYSVPASANSTSVDIGAPLVSATEVLPNDNVTVSVAITCTNPNPGTVSHGGCTDISSDVDQGSVEIFAYLPGNLPSCDADPAPADEVSLGIDNDGAAGGWNVAFTPAGQGLVEGNVYFIRVEYTGDTSSRHGTTNSDLNSGCAGSPTLLVEEPLLRIELVSGPTLDDDITDVIADPPMHDPNNDGLIWLELSEPQYFTYNIIIDNDDPAAIDLVVSDVVSDVFDIDDRADHGVASNDPDCLVTLAQPSATAGKEVEFVMVDAPAGVRCTVEVHLVTVADPSGSGFFEPLAAAARAIGSMFSIHDTFSLNEGAKVFDAPADLSLGERLFGPLGSLQLNAASPIPPPFS